MTRQDGASASKSPDTFVTVAGRVARRVEGMTELPRTGEHQRVARKLNEFKPLDEG
jgi:hypothetical protein